MGSKQLLTNSSTPWSHCYSLHMVCHGRLRGAVQQWPGALILRHVLSPLRSLMMMSTWSGIRWLLRRNPDISSESEEQEGQCSWRYRRVMRQECISHHYPCSTSPADQAYIVYFSGYIGSSAGCVVLLEVQSILCRDSIVQMTRDWPRGDCVSCMPFMPAGPRCNGSQRERALGRAVLTRQRSDSAAISQRDE